MNFNERLTSTRKMKGLSQESLADKMGVSRQAVSKWETGDAQPDYQKLVALADVLDVSMDYLCCRTDDVKKEESNKKKSCVIFVILTVAVAMIAFYIGTFFGVQKETVSDKMPDTITVSGVNFSSDTYQFVPSVVSDDLTYKIVFCDWDGNQTVFEVPCDEGICYGTADLKGSYTNVAVVISDGEESRAMPIAQDLNVGENSASWTPVE